MSLTEHIQEHNARYASRFDRSTLALPPARLWAIVACMDARLTVEEVVGIGTGDAHIIRNAGGLATDDAIRSLVISTHLLGTNEFAVIEHTGCGMLTFEDEPVRRQIAERTGADTDDLRLFAFRDLEANLREQVRDLLDKKQLEGLLSKNGVTPTTTIIAYGDNNNWFAAWFFSLLKYYGHKNVKLVNGGRAKWIAEKRPLANDAPSYPKSEYRAGTPDASIRALRDNVLEKVVAGNGTKIVDVRSPKEYAGELLAPENLPQEGAQRGGHIPGAQNIPWATAVAEDGRFKSADELKNIYGSKGIDGTGETIAYCRIGERSAHTWFVLKYLLGQERVRNYEGSWTEWGSLIGVPIEKGAAS